MSRLLHSSKALAALAGILINLVLIGTGQMDAETGAALITGLLGVLAASIAFEDGQKHKSPSTVVQQDLSSESGDGGGR